MEKNAVVKCLENILGKGPSYICGEIKKPGTNGCSINGANGSVYGIAIKFDKAEDAVIFFDAYNEKRDKVEKWKPIDDCWYPLYWGKDKNMGARLSAHLKAYSGTGTLQLNTRKYLQNHKIIYGSILSLDNSTSDEDKMRETYPDIFITKKG